MSQDDKIITRQLLFSPDHRMIVENLTKEWLKISWLLDFAAEKTTQSFSETNQSAIEFNPENNKVIKTLHHIW